MIRWEYKKIEYISNWPTERELNALGGEGWQVVGMSHSQDGSSNNHCRTVLLMRPKP